MNLIKKFIKWIIISIILLIGIFVISYLIATSKGIWGFVILGIVVFGIILYVSETMIVSFNVAKPHKKYKHSKIKKTKISYQFKELYNYIEKEYASDLEKNRKKLLKSIATCIGLFIISFILYFLLCKFLNYDIREKTGILGIVFIPAVIYYMYKYKKYNEIYLENYKDKIIKNFVTYINNDLVYYQYGGKHLFNYYLDANFNDKYFNSYVTDDYIEGYNSNNTKIEICNITLEKLNDNGEFLDLSYEGIFSVTKLNISLPEELRIIKNSLYLKNDYNKVKLDSQEFEKYFDVYSNSNILAFEILTHDIMEELVEFYNTYKINFELVLKNENIYIRFDTGSMFEPNILKKSNDMNTLWVYYNILMFVTNLTIKINKLLKNLDI